MTRLTNQNTSDPKLLHKRYVYCIVGNRSGHGHVTMSEVKKTADSRRVAAYSMLLALHRYAKWVSSLQSAKPSNLVLADRELRLISVLRDEHFRVIARQIDAVDQRHHLISEAIARPASPRLHQSPRATDVSEHAAIQAEAVSRLVSVVERYLQTPATPHSSEVVVGREAASKTPNHSSALRA